MRTVGFYVAPGFLTLDLAGPLEAFEWVEDALGTPCYHLRTFAAREGIVTSRTGLAVEAIALRQESLDTLVVVGGSLDEPPSDETVELILAAAHRCRRVASVCVGAFALAATGLLDGRRATTHWRYATHLQQRFPKLRVEADRIYTRDGRIWTSAGITAGIDLALALIEEDCGFPVAQRVAQNLVVHHRRHGGQSQFAASVDAPPANDRIATALIYARDHVAEVLTVERLAGAAGMSLRQFSRAFRTETGTTPARMVERLRADLARGRVETTVEPVERIAEAVGFGDAENMRRAFIRLYGQPPQSVRRQARG